MPFSSPARQCRDAAVKRSESASADDTLDSHVTKVLSLPVLFIPQLINED